MTPARHTSRTSCFKPKAFGACLCASPPRTDISRPAASEDTELPFQRSTCRSAMSKARVISVGDGEVLLTEGSVCCTIARPEPWECSRGLSGCTRPGKAALAGRRWETLGRDRLLGPRGERMWQVGGRLEEGGASRGGLPWVPAGVGSAAVWSCAPGSTHTHARWAFSCGGERHLRWPELPPVRQDDAIAKRAGSTV